MRTKIDTTLQGGLQYVVRPISIERNSTIVTVYSKPSCVQCNATYRKLDEKGIKYEIEDITLPENEHLLLAFKERDLLSAPIVVTPTDEWSGYRPDKIDELALAY